MRREERDAQARTEIERGGTEPYGLVHGHLRVLRRGTPGALVGSLPEPHPLTDQRLVDARTDRLDNPGAIVMRDLPAGRRRTTAGLPVGRVHPGQGHPDQHLTRIRLRDRPLDQFQHVNIAGTSIDDRLHRAPSPLRRYGTVKILRRGCLTWPLRQPMVGAPVLLPTVLEYGCLSLPRRRPCPYPGANRPRAHAMPANRASHRDTDPLPTRRRRPTRRPPTRPRSTRPPPTPPWVTLPRAIRPRSPRSSTVLSAAAAPVACGPDLPDRARRRRRFGGRRQCGGAPPVGEQPQGHNHPYHAVVAGNARRPAPNHHTRVADDSTPRSPR